MRKVTNEPLLFIEAPIMKYRWVLSLIRVDLLVIHIRKIFVYEGKCNAINIRDDYDFANSWPETIRPSELL